MKKFILLAVITILTLQGMAQESVKKGWWVGKSRTFVDTTSIKVVQGLQGKLDAKPNIADGIQALDTFPRRTEVVLKTGGTFTGAINAPTPAAGTNTDQVATAKFVRENSIVSYAISVEPTQQAAPVDATTLFLGGMNSSSIIATSWLNARAIYIPFNCTLVAYSIISRNATSASTEATSIYVRVNDATDILINNTITWPTASATYSYQGNNLNMNYNENDKIMLKVVYPTWVTNPTAVYIQIMLYFKSR